MMNAASNFNGLPACLAELMALPRWVGWRWESRTDKLGNIKKTKPPFQVHGGYAHNDKPNTWATFAEIDAVRNIHRFEGVGLELLNLTGFAALDLDKVRNPETGEVLAWAADLIRCGSYAEVTPSGTGFRVLGRVDPNHEPMHGKKKHPGGGEIEFYVNPTTGRYITVTGDRTADAPDALHPIDKVIADIRRAVAEPDAFNDLPDWLKDTISHGYSGDRSGDFQRAVNGLAARVDFDTALRIFERFPSGPAAKYQGRLDAELRRSWGKANDSQPAASKVAGRTTDGDPVDLWGQFIPPELPSGLLPPLIEEFARIRGEQMGADHSGLAMAALTTCAAAIRDEIKVQVKVHDPSFVESARLWTALVGDPSTRKSPIISAASGPLCRIDMDLFRSWCEAKERWAKQDKDERPPSPPAQTRLRIEDATVEAAQQVLEGSPWGVLLLQDELSGFFGQMDRYNGGKGASADRAFWLRAWNGGQFALNRVGRGAVMIPNLSVSLLGGIQPEPIRRVSADAHDDGLLQRLFPIVLRPATLGQDAPVPNVQDRYEDLINRLWRLNGPLYTGVLTFSPEAQEVRRRLEERHLTLQASEAVSRKLGSHIGKFDGMFARLALTFHCIEHPDRLPDQISGDTARRAGDFLHKFLLPHAVAFYGGILGLSDDHDRLKAVAGYILARRLDTVTNRTVNKGDGTMRNLAKAEIQPIFEQLAALGWLVQKPGPRPTSDPHWDVNPVVHHRFADRAIAEADRRQNAREAIIEMLGQK